MRLTWIFLPLMTNWSPSMAAVVLRFCTSEPDSSSDVAIDSRFSPRNTLRTTSSPQPGISVLIVLLTEQIIAQLVSTRPSSSIAMPSEMKSISRPPRLRGPVMPIRPAWPIFGMMSWVGSCSTMSHSRTYGAISRCAKSRTYARNVSCSSLKEKSSAIGGFLKGMDLQVVRTS